jgi:streptogramin lyase
MIMRFNLLAAVVIAFGNFSVAECGVILATDEDTSTVLAYDSNTGAPQGVFASGGGLSHYVGIARGPDGNVYVSTNPYPSSTGGGVLRFDGQTGNFISTFVPAKSGGLNLSQELHFGPGNKLYVAGFDAGVLRYDSTTGAFVDKFIAPGSGGLIAADDAIFGPDGRLYVADDDGSQILRYDGQSGAFIDAFVAPGAGGLVGPASLQFGPDGNLYVADNTKGAILRYDGHTGAFIDDFVAPGAGLRFSDIQFGANGILYASSVYSNPGIYRYNGADGAFIDKIITPPAGTVNGPAYFLLPLESPRSVPEPSSMAIFLVGSAVALCVLMLRRRRIGRRALSREQHAIA